MCVFVNCDIERESIFALSVSFCTLHGEVSIELGGRKETETTKLDLMEKVLINGN